VVGDLHQTRRHLVAGRHWRGSGGHPGRDRRAGRRDRRRDGECTGARGCVQVLVELGMGLAGKNVPRFKGLSGPASQLSFIRYSKKKS
jgi:hypothetical protein